MSQVSIILSAETALLAIGLLFTGTLSDHYGKKINYRFAATWRTADDALSSGRIMGDAGGPACGYWPGAQRYRCRNRLYQRGGRAGGGGWSPDTSFFGNSMGGMSGVLASQLIDHISINTIFYGFAISLILVALLVNFFTPGVSEL